MRLWGISRKTLHCTNEVQRNHFLREHQLNARRTARPLLSVPAGESATGRLLRCAGRSSALLRDAGAAVTVFVRAAGLPEMGSRVARSVCPARQTGGADV